MQYPSLPPALSPANRKLLQQARASLQKALLGLPSAWRRQTPRTQATGIVEAPAVHADSRLEQLE